jgi:hypothetical protein
MTGREYCVRVASSGTKRWLQVISQENIRLDKEPFLVEGRKHEVVLVDSANPIIVGGKGCEEIVCRNRGVC